MRSVTRALVGTAQMCWLSAAWMRPALDLAAQKEVLVAVM